VNDAEEYPHQGSRPTSGYVYCYNPYIVLLFLICVEVKLDTENKLKTEIIFKHLFLTKYVSWKILRKSVRIIF